MNNYHIYEEIGKGKFSTVYKGRKKKSIEYVAVKMLEKSRRKKVLNEVRIFHNLNHPNILKFYNWYETRNHLWIIFEYCAGGDLLQLIEQDKTLSEPAIRNFGKDLVNALLYLHSNGIIYCDLKPSNVLFNEYGSLKLCDFGLSKKIVDLVQLENNSESGPKKGTPYYMAPELFQDEGVHSFASDFWALGCILYELAISRPPFTSSSFQELVGMILNAEIPDLNKLSQQLSDLLVGLLQKDPNKRITWNELKTHPFWQGYEFPQMDLPPQPHFDSYLASKGLTLQPYSSALSNKDDKPYLSDVDKKRVSTPNTMSKKSSMTSVESGTTGYSSNKQPSSVPENDIKKNVNLLRLSQNILKNRDKEFPQSGYGNNKEGNGIDIKLVNQDQELDFGDGDDEEEDEESAENNSAENNQDEGTSEEEPQQIDPSTLAKIDFNKKSTNSNSKSPRANTPSNKTTQGVKTNNRMKPENDELGITPKNGRSNPNLIKDAEKLATANLLPHKRSDSQTPTSGQNKAKIPLPKDLINHGSDTIVKPITGNREIEKPQETVFNKELLPFAAMTLEEVVSGIETAQVESHLGDIYGFLANNNNNAVDKLNTLCYFEVIVQNSSVANRLVNSAFMSLLVKLLKTSKNVNLKAKVCCIIGQLIRHATVIDNELSQLNIPSILMELLKEKNEKLKRKAVAALGEYLFYGATQMDEDSSEVSAWDISNTLVSLLNKILKSNEDEVVKFYVCKTIENITAQSVSAGNKFATLDTVQSMFSIINTTKNENLKVCATVCLNHISRLSPSLVGPIIEKITVKQICAGFNESNPRIQQVYITLFDWYLYNNINNNKAYTFLAEEKALIPSLLTLLDHSSVVIRGKTLLAFYFMFKTNLKWTLILGENKVGPLLDKFGPLLDKPKDSLKYVDCCLIHLVDLVAELIPPILKSIADDLKKLKQLDDDSEAFPSKDQTNYLGLLPMILGVMNSSVLRNKVVNTSFLTTMFNIYDYSENLKDSINEQFRTIVFMIFESLSSNHKLLVTHNEVILQVLFPNLLSKLTRYNDENIDTRFNSLKLFTDILIQYINEDSIYDVAGSKPSAKIINDIITKKLLVNIEFILSDQEPVPLYGLKLFSIIFGKNIQFVAKLKQDKTLNIFLEYFNYKHPRLTSNTLKIIQKIVECRQITLDDLSSLNFVEKAVSVLKYFWSNQQEWCYEELLDIFYNLFWKILDVLKASKVPIINPEASSSPVVITDQTALVVLKQNDLLVEVIDILASLCSHVETIVAEKSLNCLTLALYLFGTFKKKEGPLKPDLTFQILVTLGHSSKQALWLKAAKCLFWFCYIQDYKLYIPLERKNEVLGCFEKQKNTPDKALSQCLREIQKTIMFT